MKYILEGYDAYDAECWDWYEIGTYDTYEEAMEAYNREKQTNPDTLRLNAV